MNPRMFIWIWEAVRSQGSTGVSPLPLPGEGGAAEEESPPSKFLKSWLYGVCFPCKSTHEEQTSLLWVHASGWWNNSLVITRKWKKKGGGERERKKEETWAVTGFSGLCSPQSCSLALCRHHTFKNPQFLSRIDGQCSLWQILHLPWEFWGEQASVGHRHHPRLPFSSITPGAHSSPLAYAHLRYKQRVMVLHTLMAGDSPALTSLKGAFDGHYRVTTHSASPLTEAPPPPYVSGHHPSHDWLSPSPWDNKWSGADTNSTTPLTPTVGRTHFRSPSGRDHRSASLRSPWLHRWSRLMKQVWHHLTCSIP